MLEGVTWFRQSSIRIRRGGVEIHIDPWGIPEESKADYILLTHPHYDNFSEDDIARVRGPDTTLVAPASMRKQLEDVDHLMRPGDMVTSRSCHARVTIRWGRRMRSVPPARAMLV